MYCGPHVAGINCFEASETFRHKLWMWSKDCNI